jgi:arylsulfatase
MNVATLRGTHRRMYLLFRPNRFLVRTSLALVLFLTSCSPAEKTKSTGSTRPSILLITIDTLRADHLGCYGYSPYEEPVTPEIDRFAEEGARFTSCFAPRAQTMPSLTSMMTGAYPSRHGILENAQSLDPEARTIFHILGDNGYDTAAFVSFVPAGRSGAPAPGAGSVTLGQDTGPGGPKLANTWEWDANTALKTIQWLQKRDSKKAFFAWVHFYDVHQPYGPPAPYDRMFTGDYSGPLLVREGAPEAEFGTIMKRLDAAALNREPLSPADHSYVVALYDGGIRATDRHIGAILRALEQQDLDEETIVIVTADHGEELGDHFNYYYHGNSVYDAALRIPLLVRWMGRITNGLVIEGLAQNVDLLPTILDWLEIEKPAEIEGISLAPAFASAGQNIPALRSAAFGEWQDLIVSARTPEWKYIYNPRGAHPKKPPYFYDKVSLGFSVACEELYDLLQDASETVNLAESLPDRASSLRESAVQHRDRAGGGRKMEPTEEENVTQELRALGYVGAPADRSDVIVGAEDCEGEGS